MEQLIWGRNRYTAYNTEARVLRCLRAWTVVGGILIPNILYQLVRPPDEPMIPTISHATRDLAIRFIFATGWFFGCFCRLYYVSWQIKNPLFSKLLKVAFLGWLGTQIFPIDKVGRDPTWSNRIHKAFAAISMIAFILLRGSQRNTIKFKMLVVITILALFFEEAHPWIFNLSEQMVVLNVAWYLG